MAFRDFSVKSMKTWVTYAQPMTYAIVKIDDFHAKRIRKIFFQELKRELFVMQKKLKFCS